MTDQPSVSPQPSPTDDARDRLAAVREEVAKAVVGQDAAVSGLLVAMLCGGHVLMEGVPGTAKTLLVRTLAAAFHRHCGGGLPRSCAGHERFLDGLTKLGSAQRALASVPAARAFQEPLRVLVHAHKDFFPALDEDRARLEHMGFRCETAVEHQTPLD